MKKPATAKKAAGGPDWRADRLARIRALIEETVPRVTEVRKWAKASAPDGVPVWECGGIICTGETYKDKVKLTFMKGAELDDPAGLFNGNDKGATRRSIDLREGDKLNERAFTALVKAAAALNGAAKKTS